MEKQTLSQQNALKSGVIYGAGLILGGFVSRFLFNTVTLEWVPTENEVLALVIGVIVGILITMFCVGIGGFIGGYYLQNPTKAKSQRGVALRSAVSLGIPFGLLLFPVIFFISTISFYSTADIAPFSFAIFFLILGAIYGLIAGLLLGLSTVGRHYFSHIVEASLVGFALGGLAMGLCLYWYLSGRSANDSGGFSWVLILLGLFLFNGLGGGALGGIYSELTIKESFAEPRPLTKVQKVRRLIYTVISLGIILFFINGFSDVLADMLIPSEAGLATILDSSTIGTHWSDGNIASGENTKTEVLYPEIYVSDENTAVLTWLQDGDVYYRTGLWDAPTNQMSWENPVQVTNEANLETAVPQTIVDSSQNIHLIWIQENSLHYAQCTAQSCAEPTTIQTANCGTTNDLNSPAIAISGQQILVTWSTGDGLAYATWQDGESAPASATGCADTVANITNTRLSAGENGRFQAIYQAGATIFTNEFDGVNWNPEATDIGRGNQPDVLIADDGKVHATWCDDTSRINHWTEDTVEIAADIPCASRPELSQDSNGRIHINWYSDQAQNQFKQLHDNHIIYETVRDAGQWQLPAVTQQTTQLTYPAVTNNETTTMHMAWVDNQEVLYASQTQYDCQDGELTGIPNLMFAVSKGFRESGTTIPFCFNQFDRFIVTPNPEPEYSQYPQTPNGGFDPMFDLAREAKYEVLFSTMWYDRDTNLDSPGYLLADAVADLYTQVQENPENYPRGVTVRILMGNPPEPTRAQFSDQVWSVLMDLHNAGVSEMVNEDLGWRVEVANFAGSLPHSHVKMMVIDGKTAVASGYNMSYEHFPANHPSGRGGDRFDLGLQMTGPVVQDTHRVFDDLWNGANQRSCTDLSLPDGQWQDTCRESKATSDHVPEVLKYYLADHEATAFSMYRTVAHAESDKLVETALASAQETIDAMHVNFTMPMICDLNLLYNICDFDDATPYLESLMQAAENGAKIRLLLKAEPIDGLETSVAIKVIQKEIEERGIADRIEFRFFDGGMHPKSALIDQEFLIIGSQNFHYSAFGDEGGLAEYSFGTDAPDAISEYQNMFDYYWERANK